MLSGGPQKESAFSIIELNIRPTSSSPEFISSLGNAFDSLKTCRQP